MTDENYKLFLICFLIFCFILISNNNFAQKNILKIDKSIICDEIFPADTIIYHFVDSLNNNNDFIYPINSKVLYKSNLGDYELHSIFAELKGDTTMIFITKQSYGLIIDVVVKVINKHVFSEIKYWEAPDDRTRKFKVLKSELILDKDKYNKGDRLNGFVNILFAGQMLDIESLESIKVNGSINGCFNIKLDKISKSR